MGKLSVYSHDGFQQENMRVLIDHLMERHEARVQALTQNPRIGHYFQALILQWEKNRAPAQSTYSEAESSLASVQAEKERRDRDMVRRGENRATMDSDEESYFNEDDDEEAATDGVSNSETSSAGPSLGLVSYTGDDDGDGEPSESSTSEEWNQASLEHDNMVTIGKEDPGPPPSLDLPPKRKKREADEEEEEDMMGRLAKRKVVSSDESASSTPGGFLKDEADHKARAGAGSKRVSISLTSDAEKMAREERKE